MFKGISADVDKSVYRIELYRVLGSMPLSGRRSCNFGMQQTFEKTYRTASITELEANLDHINWLNDASG